MQLVADVESIKDIQLERNNEDFKNACLCILEILIISLKLYILNSFYIRNQLHVSLFDDFPKQDPHALESVVDVNMVNTAMQLSSSSMQLSYIDDR